MLMLYVLFGSLKAYPDPSPAWTTSLATERYCPDPQRRLRGSGLRALGSFVFGDLRFGTVDPESLKLQTSNGLGFKGLRV